MTMKLTAQQVRRFGWHRLARIYLSRRATNATRRMIEREARRCGYNVRTIITLHA